MLRSQSYKSKKLYSSRIQKEKEKWYMLCIKNGLIHDGVNREAYYADILVEDGKICKNRQRSADFRRNGSDRCRRAFGISGVCRSSLPSGA